MSEQKLQYRYAGTRPYLEADTDLFFGRSNEVRELFGKIQSAPITLMHSKSGHGKTSLLNAGIVPMAKMMKTYEVFSFRLGGYSEEKNHISPVAAIFNTLKVSCKKESYIDKLIPESESVWLCLKKMQAAKNKTALFIFDQFEELFTYPVSDQIQFLTELKKLITEIIPAEYKTAIKKSLTEYNSLLSPEGQELLYKKIDLKIVFSLRTDSLTQVNKASKFLPQILENSFQLLPLKLDEAKKALLMPAAYKAKYEGLVNFASENFNFAGSTPDVVLESLKNADSETIEPYRLQVLCSYFEQKVIKENLKSIVISSIEETEEIHKNFYDNLISELGNAHHEQAARIFIEEGLILESERKRLSVYEGVIPARYNISTDLLQKLSDGRLIKSEKNAAGDVFYELSHETLVQTVLTAKKRRLDAEKAKLRELESAKALQHKAENQIRKSKKVKITAGIVFLALLVSVGITLLVNSSRKQAQRSEARAQSSLLAVYAYQELESDPTVSFRLAEEAYRTDPTNEAAISALVNSYYDSEVFYSEVGLLPENIISAKISPNREKIVMASRNRSKKQFEVILTGIDGNVVFTKQFKNTITFVAFAASKEEVLVADRKGLVTILNFEGKQISSFQSGKPVWLVKYSPDNSKLLVSSGSEGVQLHSPNGDLVKQLPSHDFDVYTADFSADGKFIVTADNISVNLCDSSGNLVKGIELPKPKSYYYPQVSKISFSPNSQELLMAVNDLTGKNHLVQIIDLIGNKKAVFRGHTDWVTDAKYSAKGDMIISGSRDNKIKLWDVDGDLHGTLVGCKGQIFNFCQGDDENVILSVSGDRKIREWKFGRFLNPLAEISKISDATFAPDGLKILVSKKKTAKLCDLTGEEITNYGGDIKKIHKIKISKSQEFVAAVCKNKTVKVWNIDGSNATVLSGHTAKINSAEFSPDSSMILTASNDSSAILWKIGQNAPIKIFKAESSLLSAKFSPKGNTILLAESSGKAVLKDLSGKTLREYQGVGIPLVLADFSPNGEMIFTANANSKVLILELSGKVVTEIINHKGKIASAVFSPDSKHIMIASSDNNLQIFALNGKEMIKLKHKGKLIKAEYSPDGKSILSVSKRKNQNAAKLWVINPEKILELTNEIKIFGEIRQIDTAEFEKYSFE